MSHVPGAKSRGRDEATRNGRGTRTVEESRSVVERDGGRKRKGKPVVGLFVSRSSSPQ